MILFLLFLFAFASAQGELVDIQKYNKKIQVDLRYSQPDNILACSFYPCRQIFVDLFVAQRLARVERELAKEGLGLVVYEGYRPPSIQKMIDRVRASQNLEFIFDDTCHYCKGLGVDVGIYYLDGQCMSVPCPWGMDCAEAYQDYPYLNANAYHNKAILERVMTHNGFQPLRERWWHFDLKGYEMAPDLEVEVADLYQVF